MKKRTAARLMTALLLAGSLAACGQGAPSAPANSEAPPPAPPPSSAAPVESAVPEAPPPSKDPITIKMFYPMHASSTTEDFGQIGDQQLAEKTGVTIEWELAPATNATERFNLMMASGSLPDVVIASPAATAANSLKKYMEAFQPLDDIIRNGNHPNLEQVIYGDEYVYKYIVSHEKDIRMIPMVTPRVVGDIFLVRGDILDKHNLTVPDSYQDWFDFLSKIKELEPGMIPYGSRHTRSGSSATPNITRMAEAWGVREVEFYEDGAIKYGIIDPRYKEFVQFARDLYAAGLLDQEYITSDTANWQEKILTKGIFMTHDNIQRIQWAHEQFAASNKEGQYYIGVLPPTGPTGERMTTIQYPRVRTMAAAVSVKSPHAERIVDMYEYIFSEEGSLLVNYGVEGVSYDMVDGVPTPNAQYQLDVAAKVVPSVGITRDAPRVQIDELTKAGVMQEMLDAKELYESSGVIKPDYLTPLVFTEKELEVLAPLKADLDTFRNEWIDKFITGIEPMEKYDEFVEKFKAIGIDQYLEIYNAALQRYLAS